MKKYASYWVQPNQDYPKKFDVWMRDTEGYDTIIVFCRTVNTAQKLANRYTELEHKAP
jgi:superfamily II DNA/RNA helicase